MLARPKQKRIPPYRPAAQRRFYTSEPVRAWWALRRGHITSPASFKSLVGWWKADSISLADATPVASLPDSSGGGRTATQGTAGFQPLFKVNQFGTGPGILFDAVDDFLSFTAGPSQITHSIIAAVKGIGAGQRRLLMQATQSTRFMVNGPGVATLQVQDILSVNSTSSGILGNQANPMMLAVTVRASGVASFYEGPTPRGQASWTGVSGFAYDTMLGLLSGVSTAVLGEIALFNAELKQRDIIDLYNVYYGPKYGA